MIFECFVAPALFLLSVDFSGSREKKVATFDILENNNLNSKILLASLVFYQEKKLASKDLEFYLHY